MAQTLAVRQADIGAALTDMWRSVLLFVPKALAFVAILVIGWFVARLALKVVGTVLERVGFDRAVERGGIGRAMRRSKYDASDILAKLAFYAVLLFTLQLAFGVWGPNPISDLISGVVAWLPRAFVAIVIVVVAAAIATGVRDLITGALGGLSYGRLLANITSIFILGLGVIAALNQVGIATTVTTPVLVAALATVAGILIVGVGGGLVKPMQARWEGWLDKAAAESRVIREQAQAYAANRREQERQRVERADAERAEAERTAVIAQPDGRAMTTAWRPHDTANGMPSETAPYVPAGTPAEAPVGHGVYRAGNASPDGAAPAQPRLGAEETQRIEPRPTNAEETQRIEPRPTNAEETQRIEPRDVSER